MSPLGHLLANAFLVHHEQNWLDSFPLKYWPLYYQWYVDDIYVLFKSSNYLKQFRSYLSSCHANTSFFIETEQNNKIWFLDVNVIHEQHKFITSVYRKPNLKVKINSIIIFPLKTLFPKFLNHNSVIILPLKTLFPKFRCKSGVIYRFQCGLSN